MKPYHITANVKAMLEAQGCVFASTPGLGVWHDIEVSDEIAAQLGHVDDDQDACYQILLAYFKPA